MRTLDEVDGLPAGVRSFVDSLVKHVAAQTKATKCLEAIAELAAAAWLAERGVLAHDPDATNPANNVVDLRATLNGEEVGIEVKSDFDTFESEIMEGRFQDDPDALGPRLRAHFGETVRTQFRWIGERPTREAWGPIWKSLRDEVSRAIPTAPALPEGQEMKFAAKLKQRVGRCYGAEVVVSRGPLVNVNLQIAGTGWQEVSRRVAAHARAKATRTTSPFLLLYVSQPPQAASIDPHRLGRVKQQCFAGERLPPTFFGLLHLHLTPSEPQPCVARGFLTQAAPFPEEGFAASLNLARLPESPPP